MSKFISFMMLLWDSLQTTRGLAAFLLVLAPAVGLTLVPVARAAWKNYLSLSLLPTPHAEDFYWYVTALTRNEFLTDCARLLKTGFAKANVIRLHANWGHVVVLSPFYAEQVRADEKLSPGTFSEREMFGAIPGFEPYKFLCTHRDLIRDVISMRLNRSFGMYRCLYLFSWS